MSEVNSRNLFEIDPEFRDYLPPQTQEQQENLKRKIIAEGPLPGSITVGVIGDPFDSDDPLPRILIDGHHTLAICEANDIPLSPPREIYFDTREAALLWMIQNQDSRRNWTKEQRDYVLGKEYKVEKKMHGGTRENLSSGKICHLPQDDGKTDEKVAKKRGVSPRSVRTAEKFADAVDKIGTAKPEAKAAILNGTSDATKAKVIAAGETKCSRCIRLKIDRHDCPQCAEAAALALGKKRKAPKPTGGVCPHCGGTGRTAS